MLWIGRDDQNYPLDRIDRAAFSALKHMTSVVDCTRSTDTVATVASNSEVNVRATITDFAFHNVESVRIGTSRLIPAAYRTIMRWLENDTSEAKPTRYAFETNNSMRLYKTPDAVHTLSVTHNPPLTKITPGDETTDPEINVDEDFIDTPLWLGAGALLVYGEAGGASYSSNEWQQFLAYLEKIRTKANAEPIAIMSQSTPQHVQ